jgi:hypothetical protein
MTSLLLLLMLNETVTAAIAKDAKGSEENQQKLHHLIKDRINSFQSSCWEVSSSLVWLFRSIGSYRCESASNHATRNKKADEANLKKHLEGNFKYSQDRSSSVIHSICFLPPLFRHFQFRG